MDNFTRKAKNVPYVPPHLRINSLWPKSEEEPDPAFLPPHLRPRNSSSSVSAAKSTPTSTRHAPSASLTREHSSSPLTITTDTTYPKTPDGHSSPGSTMNDGGFSSSKSASPSSKKLSLASIDTANKASSQRIDSVITSSFSESNSMLMAPPENEPQVLPPNIDIAVKGCLSESAPKAFERTSATKERDLPSPEQKPTYLLKPRYVLAGTKHAPYNHPEKIKAAKAAAQHARKLAPIEAKLMNNRRAMSPQAESQIEPHINNTSSRDAASNENVLTPRPRKTVHWNGTSLESTADPGATNRTNHIILPMGDTSAYVQAFKKYSSDKSPPNHANTEEPRSKEPRDSKWTRPSKDRGIVMAYDEGINEESCRKAYLDGGWGEPEKHDVNSAAQLLDFEGNVLPAPVEWAERGQCKRDNWCEFILKYLENDQPHFKEDKGEFTSTCVIETSTKEFIGPHGDADFGRVSSYELGEVVPKEWIPEQIEGQSLQSFWKSYQQSEPKPEDDEDLRDNPFWLRYQPGSLVLKPHQHESAICEAIEPGTFEDKADVHELWLAGKSQTAITEITKWLNERDEKIKEQKSRRHAEKALSRARTKEIKIAPPPSSGQVRAKISLRPMNIEQDVEDAYAIYSHYVSNTCQTLEISAQSQQNFKDYLEAIKAAQFPIIVAIERLSTKQSRPSEDSSSGQAKILGYAMAHNPNGHGSQMDFVAHLETYVHPESVLQGVGKSLLDRMLWLLDPMYKIVSDVRWDSDQEAIWYSSPGGTRLISAVRISLFYAVTDGARCAWMNEMLKKFGFVKEADYSKCGIKLKQWTRQAVWQRVCESELDAETVVRSKA